MKDFKCIKKDRNNTRTHVSNTSFYLLLIPLLIKEVIFTNAIILTPLSLNPPSSPVTADFWVFIISSMYIYLHNG